MHVIVPLSHVGAPSAAPVPQPRQACSLTCTTISDHWLGPGQPTGTTHRRVDPSWRLDIFAASNHCSRRAPGSSKLGQQRGGPCSGEASPASVAGFCPTPSPSTGHPSSAPL
ncbi:uncharacterized protein A4U43_C07F9190 [Asparagus officinalis]|uniref:Uncharacterized protein n=1 Tax=Asparagus officinalis TaxID=4686 RepID=A0A5P1EFP0_ASPOF|nr:uncharacterized protein A4U43_C07F9190 [Asparagus officinalis]